MNKINAKASEADGARELTIEYNLGENLDEAVQLYGKEVVHQNFVADTVVKIQGIMRRLMGGKEPKNDKEIVAFFAEWKPVLKSARGKSQLDKTKDAYGKLSDEEKKVLLAQLKAGK